MADVQARAAGVKGGQGRSDGEVYEDGVLAAWLLIGAVIAAGAWGIAWLIVALS